MTRLSEMPQDEMQVFELKPDGQLTRDLIDEVGDEYSISERLKLRILGIGQLKYISGNSILDEFYSQNNQAIKTHFDWTKNGAVVRLKTMANLYTIGLDDKGLRKIKLIKHKDYIYAMPYFPFWTLLKLDVPIKIAKWFKMRGDKFDKGKCEIHIEHNDNVLAFEFTGDLWPHCIATFRIDRVKDRLIIEDRRTWVTDNGFSVNSGAAANNMSP